MPKRFCISCGYLHKGPIDANCEYTKMNTRQGGRLSDTDPSLHSATYEPTGMTVKEEEDALAERERALAEKICQLERWKRVAVLERQERQLEEEMEELAVTEKCSRSSQRQRTCSRERRHQHQWQRSTSSSSTFDSSTSRERRLRSKWSIKRFLEDRKDLKKVTPFELIESSCSWVLECKDLDVNSLKQFVKHIGYMAGKAKSGRFMDQAHANYDIAIRKLAAKEGFEAFSAGNPELALKYYAFEYMRKPSGVAGLGYSRTQSGTKQLFIRDGKKPCFSFNKEEGCSRDDKTCNFGHWCSRCGSRSHIRAKCHRD